MSFNQRFFKNENKMLFPNTESNESTGSAIGQKDIDWTNAVELVKDYQNFLDEHDLSKYLSFSITKDSINKLLNQQQDLDAVKFYLAYSESDKTIQAFAIASKQNTATGGFDDYKIPESNVPPTPINEMPLLENVRPCPHQCGKLNILNKEY